MGGKDCMRCNGKTLLGVVNNILKTKSLLISSSNVLPNIRRSMVRGADGSGILKEFRSKMVPLVRFLREFRSYSRRILDKDSFEFCILWI